MCIVTLGFGCASAQPTGIHFLRHRIHAEGQALGRHAMKGTFALFDIAGYVALLLWGTHMVTSGVLRGYGSALRRSLGRFLGTRPSAFAFGVCITALLQSSTATGMM